VYVELRAVLATVHETKWMTEFAGGAATASDLLEVAGRVAHMNSLAKTLKQNLVEVKPQKRYNRLQAHVRTHARLLQNFDALNTSNILDSILTREVRVHGNGVKLDKTQYENKVVLSDAECDADGPVPVWRTGGVIAALGPFGHLPVSNIGVKLSISRAPAATAYRFVVTAEGMAAMDAAKKSIYLKTLKLPDNSCLAGKLSDLHAITVDKGALGLERAMRTFAWCYPADGLNKQAYKDIFAEIEKQNLGVDDFDYFLLNGGYVYWEDRHDAARAVNPHPSACLAIFNRGDTFMFTAPRSLPDAWRVPEMFGAITIRAYFFPCC